MAEWKSRGRLGAIGARSLAAGVAAGPVARLRALCHCATLPLCHFFLLAPSAVLANPTGTIALKPAARVQADAPVRLGDIATLAGPGAESLADLTVLPVASTDWQALTAEAIRAAIDEQADPVWGHLTFIGAECRVRAIAPAAPAGSIEPAVEGVAAVTDPTTVRAVVEQRLAATFACEVSDLRLDVSPRDEALLGQSAIGRTVDVQPTGFSERVPLRITIVEGERLVTSTNIRVGVLVRREVAVTPVALARGHQLAASDLVADIRWLPADVRPLAIDDAPGMVLRTRLQPGSPVALADVETPIIVRRGQPIQVHSVDGAVSLQIRARALEDGREGDVIRCVAVVTPQESQPRSGRDARSAPRPPARGEKPREFLARLAAPGVAIAVQAEGEPGGEAGGPSVVADEPSTPPATPGIHVTRTGPIQ